jgi:hypothetical protein
MTTYKQLNNKGLTGPKCQRPGSPRGENMAEAAVITAVGRNKKSIKVGDTVKYVNSDTISCVTEIKKDEQGDVWVLLESTGLWYKDETLEPTELKAKEKKEERELTPEELEERFRKQREAMQAFDLGKAGGGGAGG